MALIWQTLPLILLKESVIITDNSPFQDCLLLKEYTTQLNWYSKIQTSNFTESNQTCCGFSPYFIFFPMKLNKTVNFVTTEEYTSYSTCYSQNSIFYEYFFHWNYYNSANKRSIRAILIMLLSSCIISYTLLPLDHGIFSGEVEWLMVAGNKC